MLGTKVELINLKFEITDKIGDKFLLQSDTGVCLWLTEEEILKKEEVIEEKKVKETKINKKKYKE